MFVFTVIYSLKKEQKKIKIFKSDFVKENLCKYKIVYKSKILPLQTEFEIVGIEKDYLKIQLICFIDYLYINDIVEGCESFEKIYRNEELRINYSKINRLGCTSYNWSIAVHFFGENTIRIFEYFLI